MRLNEVALTILSTRFYRGKEDMVPGQLDLTYITERIIGLLIDSDTTSFFIVFFFIFLYNYRKKEMDI